MNHINQPIKVIQSPMSQKQYAQNKSRINNWLMTGQDGNFVEERNEPGKILVND
jgi:hypothetical protein